MTKHTPGPWKAIVPEKHWIYEGQDLTSYAVYSQKTKGELRDEGFTHYNEDPDYVDNVWIVFNNSLWDMSLEEGQANARLIAAAPELLEAAQDLLTDIDNVDATVLLKGGPVSPSLVVNLRAAIAKATGEAS